MSQISLVLTRDHYCEVCSDNRCFVCVPNSRNIIPLFHKKVISHDPLPKIYPNLVRTRKNKFYENEIL